jgi:hypothetical protein
VFIPFRPGVDQVENTVVAPDPRPDLLVHPNSFGPLSAKFHVLRRPMKLAVLRQVSGGKRVNLVDELGVRQALTAGLVVALVD